MHYTDLSYIQEISMGDKSVLIELSEMFISQVKEFQENFRKFLDAKDWNALSKEAHKAKSSISIFGMVELSEALKDLQDFAEKEEKIETYASIIELFEVQCQAAIIELKEEMKE